MRGEDSRLTGTDLENGFSLVAGAKPYFFRASGLLR